MRILEILLWIINILSLCNVAFVVYLEIVEFFVGHRRAEEAYENNGFDIEKVRTRGILSMFVALITYIILEFAF